MNLVLSQSQGLGLPQIRDTFLGVPLVRTIILWVDIPLLRATTLPYCHQQLSSCYTNANTFFLTLHSHTPAMVPHSGNANLGFRVEGCRGLPPTPRTFWPAVCPQAETSAGNRKKSPGWAYTSGHTGEPGIFARILEGIQDT